MKKVACTAMYLGLVVGIPAVLALAVSAIWEGATLSSGSSFSPNKLNFNFQSKKKPSIKSLKGYRPL